MYREGNLRAYRELLEREEESFVEAGIFLLLEQLRALVLRNLFKRVYANTFTDTLCRCSFFSVPY